VSKVDAKSGPLIFLRISSSGCSPSAAGGAVVLLREAQARVAQTRSGVEIF